MNVLKPHLKTTVITLIQNKVSQHEIHRKTGVDRKTIRSVIQELTRNSNSPMATGPGSNPSQIPPPRPPDGAASNTASDPRVPAHARSACEPHRAWIAEQVGIGRNAQAIYQDLVDRHGFTHRYNSVKRFVRGFKRRASEQYDRLEFLPGEEAQVDYGEGAPTFYPKTGKYRKPRLFVMTLKYSRRSFRKVVWASSQETWARLHEEAFRYFGGCPQYVVLDNLKEGVIKPDLYEPELNRVYASMLAHYGVTADPARVRDPDRKGTVENAIQHTQATALKGRRFASLDEQNEYLLHWEEKWAAPRIHGRTKRQVEAMFQEEKPYLKELPLRSFRYFTESVRTVQDDGTVQVESCWYAARPAMIGSTVLVRIYDLEIEILHPKKLIVLRRHPRSTRKGHVELPEQERIYNPSRQTQGILAEASRIGPKTRAFCEALFADQGREGHRRMRGIVGLAMSKKHPHPAYRIERACAMALDYQIRSYQTVRQIIDDLARQEAQAARATESQQVMALTQEHELIRDTQEYFAFWNEFATSGSPS